MWIFNTQPKHPIKGQPRLFEQDSPFGKMISGHFIGRNSSEDPTTLLALEEELFRRPQCEGNEEEVHILAALASSQESNTSSPEKTPQQEAKKLKDGENAFEKNVTRFTENAEAEEKTLQDLALELQKLNTLETMGVEKEDTSATSAEHESAVKQFQDSITFDGKCYSVKLCFKENSPRCSTNKNTAKAAFFRLEKRLEKDKELYKMYKEAIQEAIDNEIVEHCDEETSAEQYYLPHAPVLKEDSSTTKVRPVFNGSSKPKHGISLNETLLSGPPGNQDILTNLIKFRAKKIVIAGDVAKMFHCIKVHQEHRDLLRFFFRDKEDKLRTFRFTRVLFGLTCSSFLAQETMKHHAKQFQSTNPKAVDIIMNDSWVDDILTSLDSKEEAEKVIKEIIQLMEQGNFKVRKWISNSPDVLQAIPEELKLDDKTKKVGKEEEVSKETKALGINWNTLMDEISVASPKIENDMPPTKRTLSSTIASIFDPLGLLIPFTVRGKLLLQETWKKDTKHLEHIKNSKTHKEMQQARKKQWDAELSEQVKQDFTTWCQELQELKAFQIPRCLVTPDKECVSKEIHMFSDASPKAFAAVAYQRCFYKDGSKSSRIITAKSKVAPEDLKTKLPRLELMGCLLASRIAKKLKIALPDIVNVTFWTDSAISLHWIRAESAKLKLWVGNRVKEIQELTSKAAWKHIDGSQNPADFGTRGISALETINNKLWLQGPEWLSKAESDWPEEKFPWCEEHAKKASQEMKHQEVLAEEMQVQELILAAQQDMQKDPCKLFLEKFSSLDKMLGAAAIFKFKERGKGLPKITEARKLETLTVFIKAAQQEDFPEARHRLKTGKAIPPQWNIAKLNVLIDNEELLRAQGRFPRSEEIPAPPILLHHKHKLTKLLIQRIHKNNDHIGPEATLHQFRKHFWCSKARRSVKEILAKCILCQRLKKQKMQQQMAPLPPFRIQEAPRPFTHVAVDYGGPLVAYKGDGTTEKCWFLLFTCLYIRAVHIELVSNMTTETLLSALRRFIARRGCPSIVYSDNAKTFKKAGKELEALQELINTSRLQNAFRGRGIQWKFQTELAPHQGGAHERLVRSTKECLRATVRTEKLPKEELETALIQAEAIINSRPMGHLTDDPSDLQPVTPAKLIQGYDNDVDPYPADLERLTLTGARARWQRRVHLQKRLLKNFVQFYIDDLRQRQKWHKVTDNLQPGDLVLVEDQAKKRLLWPLAVITDVTLGRDNLVRSVTLQTQAGIIRRPVQRLVKLELEY